MKDWPLSGDMVEVVWRDHSGAEDWDVPNEHIADAATLCRTVGYVLHENEDLLIVCQNQCLQTGKVDRSIAIVKELIDQRRRVLGSTPLKKEKQ